MKNRNFSMLELLAVIFVIALLMALLLPSIARVKKMANLSLCSKNLKDIHALAMSYSVDHNNTLPGVNVSDHPLFPGNFIQNNFYYGAIGHLVPYVDRDFNGSRLVRGGRVSTAGQIVGVEKNQETYHVLADAMNGVGIFKLFRCPEITQNIIEPNVYTKGGGIVPKVHFLHTLYPEYVGMPTTYMYNDDMMHPSDPVKISELQDFGKKIMFMEGGVNAHSHKVANNIPVRDKLSYRFAFSYEPDGNHQLSKSMPYTFAHDDEEEYWYSNLNMNPNTQFKVNRFNDAFAPEVYIAYGSANTAFNSGHFGEGGIYTYTTLVTHVNPYKNPADYKYKTKKVLDIEWSAAFSYVGDDISYKPSIGKSNILYGDGSVKTEHVSWLFANRFELLITSKKVIFQ